MQLEVDVGSLFIGNLMFAFYMTPMVLIGASVLRGLLLFSGQKREFEDWTRNKIMTILSIAFLPGSLAFIGIRLVIARLFRVDVEEVGGSSTYGEINVFLKVDKPPRVGVVLIVLFLNVVMAVFLAFMLIVLPVFIVIEPLWFAVLLWVSVGILFNCSLRSGDLSLVVASIRNRPRSGAIEFITFMVVLGFIYYIRFAGVVV